MNETSLIEQMGQANEARRVHDTAGAIQLYTAVLEETDAKTEDPAMVKMRLLALRQRGLLQRRLGHQEAAMSSYRQFRQEARTSQQQVLGTELVAQQHSSMGEHEKAMGLHREALQLAETLNYTYGRALTLQGLAATYFYLGRYEEALSHIEKSLSLFRQLDDVEEKTRTWNWMGMIRQRQGQIDKSIVAFKSALEDGRQVGEMETAVILTNLGESYQLLYDMQQALVYHREALTLAEKIDLPSMEVDMKRNMGVELSYLGQMDEGIENLRQSLRLSEVVGQPFLTYQAIYSLALAEHARDNNAKAAEYGQRLLDLADQSSARDFRAQAMHVLGLCAQAEGDLIQAEQLWQQALFLAHETGQQTLLWQLHAALAEISPNPALAGTHYRIAAEVLEQIIYPLEDESLRQTFLSAPPVKAVFAHLNQT
ncbi:MAG TPA: tetratricopeptide repeat protein [Chloroflexota bacterium]|nr:tetratricopeptide repeat protein [Chloroflexota bacterium]HUM67937.1 tetratricopeptide repeat protein [Chloroflexota bacterium]